MVYKKNVFFKNNIFTTLGFFKNVFSSFFLKNLIIMSFNQKKNVKKNAFSFSFLKSKKKKKRFQINKMLSKIKFKNKKCFLETYLPY